MTCDKVGSAIVCFNRDYRIRDRNGKAWYFEHHHFMGPSILKKNGDPARRQPGEKSPFWEAFQYWFDQGKETKKEGDTTWATWYLKVK